MRPVLPCVLFFMVVRVVCAADLIASRDVRGKMGSVAHLYDFTKPTYDRAMAISILQKYLTDHHKRLSTYDQVRILTKMAQINTIHNIDRPENLDQAASHMRQALAVANGNISEAALWCALNVSNIKTDRKKRLKGELSYYMFRITIAALPDQTIREMMLTPVGPKDEVEKDMTKWIAYWKNTKHLSRYATNIQSLAENVTEKEVANVCDMYWVMLELSGDVALRTEGIGAK